MARRSDDEEDVTADKNGTPVPRERERTTKNLRRSPRRSNKMKVEKTGQQHQERSCEVPSGAALKSVKT
jgi:hypothetical protein